MNDNEKVFSGSENGTDGSITGHDRLIGIDTVVTLLGVCARTVHRLVAAGELPPPAKVGRASRWFMTDIDTYMERLRQARSTGPALVPMGGAA